MREIFFRGQTRRKGQKVWMDGSPVESNWVFGGVCHGTGDFSIIYGNLDEERERPTEKWVVYTDTVGQFTGLTDKNGKKIFEGDIVEVIHEGVYLCRWDEGNCEFGLINENESFGIAYVSPYDIVVIGNIHDDPELLGGDG